MKWAKFNIAGTNYLNTMKNTNEPSQERNETNQSEDPNPELNEENPELNKENSKLNEENPEDELHGDLNQLRTLGNPLRFPSPHHYKT